MANVDFDMTVQQTVINVTDQTGETFEVTPQPKVEVSVAEGSGGGSSSGGSGLLEKFWDVVPEDSEEIISEEDIHAAIEDIWNTTFNS